MRTMKQVKAIKSSINSVLPKLLAIGLLSLISTVSFGQEDRTNDGPFFGKQAKGKWIIGIKAAQIDNNIEDLKDADAIGVVLGYEFDRPIGGLGGRSSVELEYLDGDDTNLAGVGTYDPDLVNLFFTYRSAGDLYYKFKVGLSYSDIEITTPGLVGNSEDVALAGGIGLGYRFSDYGKMELEYSADAGNNDLGAISFNALLDF